MRKNYMPLGNYIQPVVGRNNNLGELPLVGLSIQKKFIPSIANTIGTDMSTYRIIEKSQFAYGPVTSRNGDKITIALFNDFEKALISQAYIPFEVKDTNELDPEYLMMWFRRPEFDRYARFKSHGSAREIFDWEEMCNTLLPVPSSSKQREIVKEYNVIQNRINLNRQLIQKLEETAQAIYKQWFVEGIDLEHLPEGWKLGKLEELVDFKNGKSKPIKSGIYPVYGGNGVIEFVDEYNSENVIPIGRVGAYCGCLYRELGKCWISDNAISAKSKINCNMFAYYLLKDLKLNERREGTGQPLITQGLLNSIELAKPKTDLITDFEIKALRLFTNMDLIEKENQKLYEMKELLLSKLATIEN
jgi:type I restriction enzyme S subunit